MTTLTAGHAGNEKPVTRFRGTNDICFYLGGREFVYFPATDHGISESNFYFAAHKHRIKSIHYGESCHLVWNGIPTVGRINLTRAEFFELAETGRLGGVL